MAGEQTWPTARQFARTYDAIADDYSAKFGPMLAKMPFDRAQLDTFASLVTAGVIVDAGCGPGQVAEYLKERGLSAAAFDLSLAMVRHARKGNPYVLVADITRLPFAAGTLGGLVAFFSIICVPRRDLIETLRGFRRALMPAAPLLVSFHVGVGELHGDGWSISYFQLEELAASARAAGFEVEHCEERPPYDFELQGRHGYVLARASPTHVVR